MKYKYVVSFMGRYMGREYGGDVEWFYMGKDTHSGSFSTGYPCWLNTFMFAERFETSEEAEEAFYRDKKYLEEELQKYEYDPETLCIRKIQLKQVRRLH